MAFKFVLILATVLQFGAALFALRLNRRYRRQSAWLLISAAAMLMAFRRLFTLISYWDRAIDVVWDPTLWAESLATLTVSILFVAGIALIEPLFQEIAQAEEVLQREKQRLEHIVQETEDEFRLARRIQRNLLPDGNPRLPGLDVAGASQAAETLALPALGRIPLGKRCRCRPPDC